MFSLLIRNIWFIWFHLLFSLITSHWIHLSWFHYSLSLWDVGCINFISAFSLITVLGIDFILVFSVITGHGIHLTSFQYFLSLLGVGSIWLHLSILSHYGTCDSFDFISAFSLDVGSINFISLFLRITGCGMHWLHFSILFHYGVWDPFDYISAFSLITGRGIH